MAVSYPIPPWLQGVSAGELGQLTLAARAQTERIQMERAKMQQEAQNAQMRLAAAQAESEQENLRQQQQAEITNAYRQAELGLRKSALDQQEQKMGIAVQQAAQKYQAQRDVEADAAKLIASGVPEDEAFIKSTLRHSGRLGMTGSSIASLARATPNLSGPKQIGETLGYSIWQVPGPRGVQTRFLDQRFARSQRASMLREQLKALQREELAYEQIAPYMSSKDKKQAESKSIERQNQMDKLRIQLEELLPIASEQSPIPDQTQSDEEE